MIGHVRIHSLGLEGWHGENKGYLRSRTLLGPLLRESCYVGGSILRFPYIEKNHMASSLDYGPFFGLEND